MIHHLVNVWLEAHVEHSVSFIQYHEPNGPEVDFASVHKVDEPARSSDEDVGPFLKQFQ